MKVKKLIFNPFDPEFHNNPYPVYARLQEEDPIHWSFLNTWVITRYDDAQAILKDNRFQVDDLPFRLQQKNAYLKGGDLTTLSKTVDKWLFFQNPPDHTKLRGLMSKTFSASSVEAMRSNIQDTVDSLLAKVMISGEMDVIRDLASPLAAITITNILGLPPNDFHKLIRWSYDLFFVFEQPVSLEGYKKQNQVAIEVREYLLDSMAPPNQNQGLISQLVEMKDQGNKLTEDEILGCCVMLLVVGQETTKSLIGNALLALLKHPKSLQELKDNPSIIKNAVEELLRYDTPVQMIARLATENIEIKNKKICKGDKVIICLGAANRDTAKFYQPNDINFHRQNSNFPFGNGIHFCLGAFLAKLQTEIAISAIVQNLSNFKLASEKLDWRETITLRSLKTLAVKFSPLTSL